MFDSQPDLEKCCDCQPSNNKCLNLDCTCYINNILCQKSCESVKGISECLNRPVVMCRCINKIDNVLAKRSLTAISITSLDKTIKGEKVKWKKSQAKISTKDANEVQTCSNLSCACSKFNEMCSNECKCKGECTNNQAIKFLSIQEQRPSICCKCKGGRKACRKDEKCCCRKLMNYCTQACKCKTDCNNEVKTASRLSKNVKLCLIQPDQIASCAIVRLTSEAYDYQFNIIDVDCGEQHVEQMIYTKFMNVLSHYTIPLRRITICLSKSPCFHQYCKPECEIIDECADNRNCAFVLAVLARQIRRRMQDNGIEINVKFLLPDTNRGDLYTNRSVATLLEAGIGVEPISMREWSQFVFDLTLINEEADDAMMHQAQSTWLACQIDQYVQQAQVYINSGRETLGMQKSYWTGRLHELFKMAVKTAHESLDTFDILSMRIEKLTKRRFKSNLSLAHGSPFLRASSTERCSILDNALHKRSGGTGLLSKQFAVFKSEDINGGGDNQEPTCSKQENQRKFSENRKSLTLSMQNLNKSSQTQHKGSHQEINRLVLAVSSRNISEEEKPDMINEMEEYVAHIRLQLKRFVDFLELKITSTAL